MSHGIHIHSLLSAAMVASSDADWAGSPDTRRSMSGYYVFLGDTLVSWSSERQTMISCSSVEADYCGIANATAESHWLRHLFQELHMDVHKATII
jgi:uncharacterized protein with NRDE domain